MNTKNNYAISRINLNELNSLDSTKTIKDFLIKSFNSEDVKIKPEDGQMICHTSEYYYKTVFVSKREHFQIIIRKLLAEIYREDYNLHWYTYEKSYNNDLSEMQIIEKEAVEVCKDKSESELADALAEITLKLENKLNHFDFIIPSLEHHIQHFNKNYQLKLLKLSKIKNIDYGITKDGKIVLLDDSDWFFVIYNKQTSNLVVTSLPTFIIEYENNSYYFTSLKNVDDYDSVITETYKPNYKFKLVIVNQFADPYDMQQLLEDQVLNYYNNLTSYVCKQQLQLENNKQEQIENADENKNN